MMKTILLDSQISGGQIQEYRNLRVWQRGMELSRRVMTIFQDQIETPDSLRAIIEKTSCEIPAIIATGYSRNSQADFVRCMNQARGSLAALDTYCMLCHQIGCLELEKRRQIEILIIETARLIEQSCDSWQSLL